MCRSIRSSPRRRTCPTASPGKPPSRIPTPRRGSPSSSFIPPGRTCAAWLWLTTGEGRALVPSGPIGLGGASAGAAVALSAAIRVRDEGLRGPDKLLLVYPFVHFPVPALDDETAAEMRALSPILRST